MAVVYDHFVFDDLREFDDVDLEITYARTQQEAIELLIKPNHVHVNHLWLDFDLGYDKVVQLTESGLLVVTDEREPCTTLRVVMELCSLQIHDEGAFTVDHIHIITANPVGRKRLFELCTEFFSDAAVTVDDPTSCNLINNQEWSES